MRSQFIKNILWAFVAVQCAWAQQSNSCSALANFNSPNIEILRREPPNLISGDRVTARHFLRIAESKA
jgi:hypothetical protein